MLSKIFIKYKRIYAAISDYKILINLLKTLSANIRPKLIKVLLIYRALFFYVNPHIK